MSHACARLLESTIRRPTSASRSPATWMRPRPGGWPRSISAASPPARCPLRSTRSSQGRRRKAVAVETPSQPFLAIAWKRPISTIKDDPAFDVLAEILSSAGPGCSTRRWCATVHRPFGHGGVDFPGRQVSQPVSGLGSASSAIRPGEREAVYGILDALKIRKWIPTLARVRPSCAQRFSGSSITTPAWRSS